MHRIAIVAAMAGLSGLALLTPREAGAQGTLQIPQALPPGMAISPATPPPNQKSRNDRTTAAGGMVIRGGDTVSLIATLPWWRVDETRSPDPGQFESPILTACDLWLGFPFATADAQSLTVRLAAAQHASEIDEVANRIKVADPGELNELDQAAPPPEEPRSPLRAWWVGTLLALLGGAAAALVTARYLFA
jgi:hypothetical protein